MKFSIFFLFYIYLFFFPVFISSRAPDYVVFAFISASQLKFFSQTFSAYFVFVRSFRLFVSDYFPFLVLNSSGCRLSLYFIGPQTLYLFPSSRFPFSFSPFVLILFFCVCGNSKYLSISFSLLVLSFFYFSHFLLLLFYLIFHVLNFFSSYLHSFSWF